MSPWQHSLEIGLKWRNIIDFVLLAGCLTLFCILSLLNSDCQMFFKLIFYFLSLGFQLVFQVFFSENPGKYNYITWFRQTHANIDISFSLYKTFSQKCFGITRIQIATWSKSGASHTCRGPYVARNMCFCGPWSTSPFDWGPLIFLKLSPLV